MLLSREVQRHKTRKVTIWLTKGIWCSVLFPRSSRSQIQPTQVIPNWISSPSIFSNKGLHRSWLSTSSLKEEATLIRLARIWRGFICFFHVHRGPMLLCSSSILAATFWIHTNSQPRKNLKQLVAWQHFVTKTQAPRNTLLVRNWPRGLPQLISAQAESRHQSAQGSQGGLDRSGCQGGG